MIKTKLDRLLIGVPEPFRDDGEMSAIIKQPVEGSILLGAFGFEGNQVADMIHHGGRDKAVHLYPADHYPFWREKYPDVAALQKPGAFGENLSCFGMTEDKLCLGDIFRIGEALIECSHARQPCWKLNHHFGKPDVLKTVIETIKSGSYFRVIEPGYVEAGNQLIQLERPHPDWPLNRLFNYIIAGGHEGDKKALLDLSKKPALAESWRRRAAQLAA